MKNEYYRHSDAKSNENSKIHSSFFFVRFGLAEALLSLKRTAKFMLFLYASVLPKPLLSLVSYINQPVPIHRHTFALSDDGKAKLTELLEVPFSIRTIGLSPVVAVS